MSRFKALKIIDGDSIWLILLMIVDQKLHYFFCSVVYFTSNIIVLITCLHQLFFLVELMSKNKLFHLSLLEWDFGSFYKTYHFQNQPKWNFFETKNLNVPSFFFFFFFFFCLLLWFNLSLVDNSCNSRESLI